MQACNRLRIFVPKNSIGQQAAAVIMQSCLYRHSLSMRCLLMLLRMLPGHLENPLGQQNPNPLDAPKHAVQKQPQLMLRF